MDSTSITTVVTAQPVFPTHLVYVFIAVIGIVVVCTLILLDRKK